MTPEGRRRLRLATFNIRYDNPADGAHAWRARRFALRQTIDALRCDVLGLQEVLPGQRRYLQAQLPAYRWYGVGREDGRRRGEQSPVLVRGGALTVTSWSTRWLSGTPEVPGSLGADAALPRVATIVLGRWAGGRIGIVSTHLDHRGARSRADAAEQIAALVAGDPGRDWVVAGDLNAQATDEPLRRLAAAGLRSVLPDDAPGTLHGFRGVLDGPRIDHLLVSGRWQIRQGRVDTARPGEVLPSDHWPVVAELEVAPAIGRDADESR